LLCFFFSLLDACVFLVTADVLVLLMSMSGTEFAFRYSAITTEGSSLGTVIVYAIGMFLFVAVAQPVLEFYHAMETFNQVQGKFNEWGVWFVVLAGFSPIPFKIITIAAGTVDLPFIPFIIAAILARAARFYLEAAIMYWGGESLRNLVEKHFQLLTMLVAVAVIGGFALLWL